MLANILLLLAIAFVVYAVWTHYQSTDPTKSVQKRVLAAIVLAAGSVGAWLSAAWNSGGIPQ